MSEPQAQATRVKVSGKAFVVYLGGKVFNVLGYLTPQEIERLQKIAEMGEEGVTWQEWQQRVHAP